MHGKNWHANILIFIKLITGLAKVNDENGSRYIADSVL